MHILTDHERHALALAPFPTVYYIPGKSWAGALISNEDFGLGRLGRGYLEGELTAEPDPVYFPNSHQDI